MNNKTNKLTNRLWLLVMTALLPALSAMAEQVVVADVNGNELVYEYDSTDGPATFTGISTYNSDPAKSGHIVIATTVTDEGGNSHEVQAIGSSLRNRSSIVTVAIPASVTTIGSSAFYNIPTLTAVTFATDSKLTVIESEAFRANKNLASINLEVCTQLTTLGNSWLYNCPAITSLTIPASVVEFGNGMFYYTDNIETITFLAPMVPSSFYSGRKHLKTVNIGAGVKSIESSAFYNSDGLTTVNFDPAISGLAIGGSAFNDCDGLKSITLPVGLVALGNSAIAYCDSLQTITFPDGCQLTTMESETFRGNKSLVSVNIEACTLLTALPSMWLYDCPSVKSLTIPASVVEFGSGMFYYTDNIETITFLAPTVPSSFYSGRKHLKTINIGPGVKSIESSAFYNSDGLTAVNFADGISDLTIGSDVFNDCDGLKTFTLPAGVVSLGASAFYGCDSLETFTFAEGSTLKTIGSSAFGYCKRLPTITLPDAVTTVEQQAFYYCQSLKEVTFGTGLTALNGSWTFYQAPVEKVVLPGAQNPFVDGSASLSSDLVTLYVHPDLVNDYRSNGNTSSFHIVAIGQPTEFAVTTTEGGQLQAKVEAIGDANNLLSLTVSGLLNGTDIDYIHSAMPNIEVLNLKETRIVAGGDSYHQWDVSSSGVATMNTWYGPWNTEDDVISRCMFYNMPRLRSLSLPKDATKIIEYAVGQDRNQTLRLKHVELPEGITEIGRYAFEWTGIETLTVPAGVTRLEEGTFANCRNLKKAVLPDGITFIGNSCFSECQSIEDVNIPAQVETIENYAFYNNANRTAPIQFPATLKTIGYHAFAYNKVVRSITFSEGLETIGGAAFSNCNAVESIRLPESLTTLEGSAFEGCDSLTEFRFPAHITDVPSATLYHCDKLQKVVLAAGTTSIAYSAFAQCPQLSDINISDMNTLTTVGAYAFENTGLTTMTLPNSITQMDYCTFQSSKQLKSINVPTGIDYVPAAFCDECDSLKSVTMHDGIRTIRGNAFNRCKALTTIALNDKITSIESYAFRTCESLQLDKLPDSLTYIGSAAFYQCRSLTGALTIPAGVSEIESDAFNMTAITAVALPEGITRMGTGIFAGCKQLTTVSLPADITRIESYMFQECTSLEQIKIPDGLKEVGYAAFDRSGLTGITLPDSLSVISDYAFAETQLREFRVPDGLRGDPGSYTWQGCKHLKTVYLGRNQDYTQLSSFTCLHGCDSLALLRIYSATPPQCNQWYMGYRTTCVLEVPEDALELYRAADVWKEFKEIRGYFDGDVLNDLDFAVMQKMYRELDGQNWKTPWDLSNNHRSMGKWQGVITVGDYITEIDLSGQGLKGELCDSLFLLTKIEKINLSNNQISANIGTLLSDIPTNTQLTEVNMSGNQLSGDIYPFAAKLPNLTRLDVSYNRLTEVSQVISNDKLSGYYAAFSRGYQFVDYQTKLPVADAPVVDLKIGQPSAIESNTLQTYRHEYGDYDLDVTDMYRIYPDADGNWRSSGWELTRNSDGLWTLYTGWQDRPLRAPKGQPLVYTHGYRDLTYILRLDWTDGDVNADQTVDVTDLQSVVYYALNDSKADGQMFNYTTADVNSDDKINVSDIVGSVEYVLRYVELPTDSREHIYNRAPADSRNTVTIADRSLVLTNADAVAALQLTVSGATARQLRVSDEVSSRFSVSMRDVDNGVRVVIYSPDGHTLASGMHQLLAVLPAGATVSDVRLADSEANRLGVLFDGIATSLTVAGSRHSDGETPAYNLNGQRVDKSSPVGGKLSKGLYIVNGKKVVVSQ